MYQVFADGAASHTIQRRTQEDLFRVSSEIVRLLSESLPVACADPVASQRLFACTQMWVRYCRIPASVLAASPLLPALTAAIQSPVLVEVRLQWSAVSFCSSCA